jgi:hypothetical protein
VVLLASKFDPFDAGRGKEAQADGHIDKPWDTQSLIDLVKSKTGLPIDNGVPQSFAATLAKRNEKPEKSDPPKSNGQPPPASPFGAPIAEPVVAARPAVTATERATARTAPNRPPPMPKSNPAGQMVTRGAGMGGSLDDVVIEEPVDDPVGPSLEPPPMPKKARPKVDVWALDEEAKRAPDAGPPPGTEDPIEEIAIDDVPMDDDEPMEEVTPPPDLNLAPVTTKMATIAAPAIAKAAEAAVPGVPSDQMVAMAREIIERIAWEVVPELAETIIKAELARLLADSKD